MRPSSFRYSREKFPVPDRRDVLALDVYAKSLRQNQREGPTVGSTIGHADAIWPFDMHARVAKLQPPPRLAANQLQERECLFLR